MFRRILIPLDGSPLAECTIPYALAIHRAFSPEVILLRVLEPRRPESSSLRSVDWRLDRESARRYLTDVAGSFPVEAQVQTEVVTGAAPVAIVEKIRKSDVDLVVLATHGTGGRSAFALGGTAHKVISAAETSVLIVRATESSPTDGAVDLSRILVGVDGSPAGEWAAHMAAVIAGAVDGELLLTHVVPRRATLGEYRVGHEERRLLEGLVGKEREEGERRLRGLAAQVSNANLAVRTRVEVDAVAPALDEIACREDQSLIVIGAHGRSSGCPWCYGSVASGLIQNSRKPLLVLQDAPRRIGKEVAGGGASRSSARLHATYAWSP